MLLKIRGIREHEWIYIEVDRIRVRYLNAKEYLDWGGPDRAVIRAGEGESERLKDNHQLVWANICYGKVQDYTVCFDTVAFLCNNDGKTIERLAPLESKENFEVR